MFDGELRADLSLSYVKTGNRSRGSGPDRHLPHAIHAGGGYRKGRRALEFLRTKSRIMVTFAQIGKTGVYAPIHATIGTQIGTITVRARASKPAVRPKAGNRPASPSGSSLFRPARLANSNRRNSPAQGHFHVRHRLGRTDDRRADLGRAEHAAVLIAAVVFADVNSSAAPA